MKREKLENLVDRIVPLPRRSLGEGGSGRWQRNRRRRKYQPRKFSGIDSNALRTTRSTQLKRVCK